METSQISVFADLLNRYRIAAGFTQEELAERAGVSARSISDMERGVPHVPRKVTVQLLASALDLSPSDYDTFAAAARSQRRAILTVPSATAHAAQKRPPRSLPAPPTPLIGRESAIIAVRDMLSRAEVRLISLVGPAGVGKTRLGLAVATDLLDAFPDGVFFVDLAVEREPSRVSLAIAKALGVNESGAEPLRERIATFLDDKRVLLLLDNFEHLTAAAPEVASMLAACPRLKALITSRAALHVRGEYVLAVEPLMLPALAQLPPIELLAQVPAIALFLARARQIRADFALTLENAATVANICAKLDGLPLAIELAAARIRVLSPRKLLALLEHRLQVLADGPHDLPARQQTLRDTLAWSYDLLSEPAQALFRRLAVFVGGCTLDTIEMMCTSLGGSEGDTLESVTMLVDHSLARQEEEADGTPRFMMLETVREYGQEQLARHGEAEQTAHAHATCYLTLAEEAESRLKGPEQAEWYARLEREHANVRTALRWALDHGEFEIGMRLGAALWRFWQNCGHITEGSEWLEAFLTLEGSDARSELAAVRATALIGAGVLAQRQGKYTRAEDALTQSLELRRGLGDFRGAASALNNLAGLAYEQDQYTRAMHLWQESLALFRGVGDTWATALLLNNLGVVASIRGDLDGAISLYEQSHMLYEASGDIWGIATTLDNQAQALYMQGNVVCAVEISERSVALCRELGAKRGIAHMLNTLANILLRLGDAARAQALSEESVTLLEEVKDSGFLAVALATLGFIAHEQRNYAEAVERFQSSLRLQRTGGAKRGVATCLEGMAAVACDRGDAVLAVRCYGMASAVREALGAPLPPVDRPAYEAGLAAAHTLLDDACFDEAWEAGRATPPETIVAGALDMALYLPCQVARD